MTDLDIRIVGLNELLRDIKRADPAVSKSLRVAGNKAALTIVSEAKARVPIGPAKGGHAKSSIKGRSTQKLVRVQGGGSRFPYYPWLDFGGRVGRKRSVVRPFLKTGRYIWKSFANHRTELLHNYDEALVQAIEDAGLDVT